VTGTNSTLWYVDRASGLTALMLLTTAVVLGVMSFARMRSERWPRFALSLLHRNLSLLALTFVVIHVLTVVADSHVQIGVVDVFVPFASAYRTLWVALGTIGVDLMLAVLITTALRRRLGFKTWRSVHLLSYGCWGAAVIHAIGIGSDARTVVWGVMIVAACIGAVGGAFVQRSTPAHPH
jgi:sulfoxide reductase heme-binding subunit YedZ